MINAPLVSILIPSYNHCQYITEAIESALNQTYKNIELIIVDDGSTDGSDQAILKYKNNSKVKISLNRKNRGQSAVLNQAFSMSKGAFIQILSSDDWFLREKTSLQVSQMQKCDPSVGVIYAQGKRYFQDIGEFQIINLPIYTGWIADKLIKNGNFIYPVTPLFRREVFNKIRFSEKFVAEGEAIHMRIALHYKYEYLNKIVGVMRDHSYNIGKNALKLNEEIEKHASWYFSLSELPENLKKLKKPYLVKNYRIKALQLIFDIGEAKKGRKNIYKCFAIKSLTFFSHPKLIIAFFLSFLPYNFLCFLKKIYDRLK